MSTFDGVIKEYPQISIDRFLEGKNYASTTYFLSHCHNDHMKGLGSKHFFNLLKSRNFSKIYLSDVSSHLLKNDQRYQHLSNYLVVLAIEEPTLVILYNEEGEIHSTVTVTLLTAGHCPGSVMFLIEGENGRVLYTGDFRLPVGSAARLVNLHENGRLKPLQSLYVDTTFCKRKCLYIPSREKCLNAIISLVEPWLNEGPNHIVYLLCPYALAYEFVFVELYKRFGVKTHVNEEWLKKYTGIKMIENAVTDCASEARIHACITNETDIFIKEFYPSHTPCGFISHDENPVWIRKIKPSAMFFTMKNSPSISELNEATKLYRVFYSTHSSLSEIRDMVNYLKPQQVYPNVVQEQTEEEILDCIDPKLLESASEASTFPSLGSLKSPSNLFKSSNENGSLPFFDECYEISNAHKNVKTPSMNVNYTSRFKENLLVETDFENTEEQETMLKEEIYSQKKEAEGGIETSKSPLKWHNPLPSSDDELFGSSPDSPLKGKYDSDVNCGTPEKNDINCMHDEKNEIAIATISKSESSKNSPFQFPCISFQSRSKYDNDCIKDFENDITCVELEYDKISVMDNCIESNFTDLRKNTSKCKLSDGSFNSLSHISTESNIQHKGQIPVISKHLNCSIGHSLKLNVVSNGRNLSLPEKSNIGSDNNESIKKNKIAGELSKSFSNNCFSEIQHLDHHKEDLKSSNLTSDNVDHLQCCTTKPKVKNMNEYKSQNDIKSSASKISESHTKNKSHRSKSYHYIKKINSSSESDEEYTFKYVIKLPEKNKTSSNIKSKILEGNKSDPESHANIKNQKERYKINFSKMEENYKNMNTISRKSESSESTFYEKNNHDSPINCMNNMNLMKFKFLNRNKIDEICSKNVHDNNEVLNLTEEKACNDRELQTQLINSKTIPASKLNNSKSFKDSKSIIQVFSNFKAPNVMNENIELVDLSSDHSDDEISIQNPLVVAENKMLLSKQNFEVSSKSHIENPFTTATSFNSKNKKYEDKDNMKNAFTNLQLPQINEERHLSDIENSYKIPKTFIKCKSKDMLKDTSSNTNVSLQGNCNEKSDESPEILLDKICFKTHKQLNASSQKQVVASTTWEVKSVNHSSSTCSIIVDEINSCSDLDDSPSLIAPVVKVSKMSHNGNKIWGNSNINSKKIKLGHDGSGMSACNNQLLDSDSTPEDLINCNFTSNGLCNKNQVPEILIDD